MAMDMKIVEIAEARDEAEDGGGAVVVALVGGDEEGVVASEGGVSAWEDGEGEGVLAWEGEGVLGCSELGAGAGAWAVGVVGVSEWGAGAGAEGPVAVTLMLNFWPWLQWPGKAQMK